MIVLFCLLAAVVSGAEFKHICKLNIYAVTMASELSKFIEDELRNKGYAYDDDDAEANDNPHTSLIGALRVEVRESNCWPGLCARLVEGSDPFRPSAAL